MKSKILTYFKSEKKPKNQDEIIIDEFDLEKLNNDYLAYINTIDKESVYERLEKVTLESVESEKGYEKAVQLLKDQGIFIVPNYLDENLVNNLVETNKELLKRIKKFNSIEDGYLEEYDITFQSTNVKIKGYNNLSNQENPVVTIRQGKDVGMIDVFNYNLIENVNNLGLGENKKIKRLEEIVSGTDSLLSLKNINLYLNKGVTETRGFHYDDFNNNIKAFIYLNDVVDYSNGPYCFVSGSHKDITFRKINAILIKDSTNAPVISVNSILPILAPRGSLVVSNQTGVHRGLPQSKDGYREVLVLRFK